MWSSPSADCRGREDGRGSEYFKWDDWISCARKRLKLFNKIKEHLINDCNFLKFMIFARGGHCDSWPRSPKNITLLLLGGTIQPFAYAFLECTGIT